eukprot:1981344-Rhodomonas_salina.2
MTLTPGLYKSTGGMTVSISDLFLDAQHDTEAVFIFQMATSFISATGKKIILMNGAKASNIFWQVRPAGHYKPTCPFTFTLFCLILLPLLLTNQLALPARLVEAARSRGP